jgi:RecQ-mediated genome instability protein 1
MASAANLQEIKAHLTTYSLHPSPTWLQELFAGQKTTVPIAALKQTALFRLIHSDFTISLSLPPFGLLPSNVLDASLPERRLRGPIPVQVLDIEDLGRSRWSQVEAIEAEERGETTKGREIIRTVAGDDEEEDDADERRNTTAKDSGNGPFKLLLQDAKGHAVYGIELVPVKGIDINMGIGSKLVLRDVLATRGVLLMESKSVTVLGGKIDDLNAKWKATRKSQLTGAVGTPEQAPA